jgi:haloacetate dehalogenase
MWWFFLIQKEPLPEHMIGADSLFFLNMHFEIQNGTPGALTDDALAEYRRCLLALWGGKGAIGKLWNVLEVWRGYADSSVQGRPLDSGHYLAEEQPEEALGEMLRFFVRRGDHELQADRQVA